MSYTFTRTGAQIEEIHNTVEDLPNIVSNENLISNSSFEIAGSVTNPPGSTPRSYNAGDELFSGFKAVGALSGVTYINGKLNGTGQLYVDIYKTEKQKLSTAPYVASIASSDGVAVESGALFVDNGDYWRVTFDMTNTFSVKFEQGKVATGHDVTDWSQLQTTYFATVAAMTAAVPRSGVLVRIGERGGAVFQVGTGSNPDGFGRLDVGQPGLRAKYLELGKAYAHHFGAKGDGSTDDADAFNAALGIVKTLHAVATTSEYLTSRIRMKSGSSVIGDGMPRFKLKGQDWGDTNVDSAGAFCFDKDIRDATLRGVSIDGNKGNHTATNLTNVECVEVDGFNNTVEYCVLYNAQSDGIDCDGENITDKQGNKFLFNKIYDCGGYGIHNSVYSNGNFIIGNEVWNCGFDGARGGIDSYYGDAISKSFGGHVFIGNKCYDNYRNYNIVSENPSVFTGNISEGGAYRDNLSGTSKGQLVEGVLQPGVDLATVLTPGDYVIPYDATGLPIAAGCSMTVRTTRGGATPRYSQTVTYATDQGIPDDSRVFMRGYDSALGFGVWKELTNGTAGDSVGEFKFLQKTTAGTVVAGDIVNGSDLVESTIGGGATGSVMTGTWKAQGLCGGTGSPVADRVARFLRVT